MALLDGPMRTVAGLLTKSLGPTVTIKRVVANYDEMSGLNLASTETTYPLKASPPAAYGKGEVNDTTILSEDLYIIVAATALEALGITLNYETDKIVIGTTTYRIVGLPPVVSGDLNAAYKVQLRK